MAGPTLATCRWVIATLVALVATPMLGDAQTPEPRFDVVSIKKNVDGAGTLSGGVCRGTDSTIMVSSTASLVGRGNSAPVNSGSAPFSPGSCRFGKTVLKEIIAAAYAVPRRDVDRLIVGGPSWIGTDQFDIEAKADGRHSGAELERMLQAVLADRFGVRLHRETRDLDGYSLIVASGGSKLKLADASAPGQIRTTGSMSLTASAASMERFAQFLTGYLGKPVVDTTALTAAYDFTMTWTVAPFEMPALPPEQRQSFLSRADPAGPSIFTAVEEQLGLRLQPRKVPAEVLVIDAANQPTPN